MQPVPLVAACSCLQGCSGLILRSGAPPTPTPASLRLPLLCKGRGKLGQPCTLVFPELQRGALRPRPREPLRQRLPLAAPGSGLSPPPRPWLPSLPPSSPAGQSAHTGAPARGRAGGGGSCCRCAAGAQPEPARSPSMLRALRPPSAQLLARAHPGKQAKEQERRGGGQGLEEGRGGLGRAGL